MPEGAFKGSSPFYPDKPVPPELFAGRQAEIRRVIERGVGQVVAGKPMAFFVQGEYGIGKSSFANLIQRTAELKHDIHGISVTLGGVRSLHDVTVAVMEATIKSGAFDPRASEVIRNWLAKYIGNQDLFGVSVNLEALKSDVPRATTPYGLLRFLKETQSRLEGPGKRALLVILDEVNGIAADPDFARFLKSLWDDNAMAQPPVHLLLMVCGTPERRRELIRGHEPIGRIFDVIEIARMSEEEVRLFFSRVLESVPLHATDEALDMMANYSEGLPKIAHLIGDAAFWADQDGLIDEDDAWTAIEDAAEELGRKYIHPQVLDVLRSRDYQSILDKIGRLSPNGLAFKRADILPKLTERERKNFDNFLNRMKRLNVLIPGTERGEYYFDIGLIQVYLALRSRISRHGA